MCDSIGGFLRYLMLPDANDHETVLDEPRIGVAIPTAVRLDFFPPPRVVGLGPSPVVGATMPEAAIDKDRDPSRSEYEIGSTPQAGQNWLVNSITQSSPM